MIYSVWNATARAYDYYESMGATPVAVPSPSHLKRGQKLGISPENAAWPRPANARLIGRGAYAKGVVAMGDTATDAPKPGVSKLFLVALMAPIVVWALRKA